MHIMPSVWHAQNLQSVQLNWWISRHKPFTKTLLHT